MFRRGQLQLNESSRKMTIRFAAPLALIALSCAGPAVAAAHDHAPATPAAAEADAKQDKQRKVCRTETATGSVMPKRVCRTVAQIEEDQRNAERFRDQQNRSGTSAR
jgi:hypothetical protein